MSKTKKYTFTQNKKYYDSLDKKRISVGTLLFNRQGELLIVKPSYKNNWILVGGTVDKGESPSKAAKREIKEETTLAIKNLQLVSIEYKKQDVYLNEALFFLFYGGLLTQKQVAKIKLPANELLEFKFVPVSRAVQILSDTAGSKLPHCLKAIKNKTIAYHENGKLIK